MLKSKYGELGMQLDDANLDRMTDFAMAKRQGRQAKAMGAQQKKAMAMYFSALVAKESAQNHFNQTMERHKSAYAAAVADKNEAAQLHIRDQGDSARVAVDAATKKVESFRNVLKNKFKIEDKHLANPVSVYAFTAGDDDHDYSGLLDDDQPEP